MGNLIPQNLNVDDEEHHDEEEESFTCEICIEPMTLPNFKFKNSNICVHPFCTDCMIKYIEVKLEAYESDIKCPATTCTRFLDPLSCRKKIPSQLFIKWCDVLCESTVLAVDKAYCPNMVCSEMILNECHHNKLKRCVCPCCKKSFCFWCKVPWHAGYSCKESGETRGENDVAFGIVCEAEGWKRCPLCRHWVELVAGCKNITCRCGIGFCYKCGDILKPFKGCRCYYGFPGNENPICFLWVVLVFVAVLVIILVLWAIVMTLNSLRV